MNPEEFQNIVQARLKELPGEKPYSKTYRFNVKQKDSGLNVIEYFTYKFGYIPKSTWLQKIESENLTVNSESIDSKYILKQGDLVQHTTLIEKEPQVNSRLDLIEFNEEYIIINKPAPLPMHGCGRYQKNTLDHFLQLCFSDLDLKITHRLDSNTTGLVVLARHKNSAQFFNKLFTEHLIKKTYLAWVEGTVTNTEFSLEQSFDRNKSSGGKRSINENGIKANTHFKVLKTEGNKTLLEIQPQTGKTNQIRLHLANIGHPILGDIGYKNENYFANNPFTYPEDTLYLHAWKLEFKDQNESIKTFEAPIPQKFNFEI